MFQCFDTLPCIVLKVIEKAYHDNITVSESPWMGWTVNLKIKCEFC